MLKNGSCHLGFACGFCHFVHGRKKKLDKSQRSILQEADTGLAQLSAAHFFSLSTVNVGLATSQEAFTYSIALASFTNGSW